MFISRFSQNLSVHYNGLRIDIIAKLGFSIGLPDFIISASNKHEIKESIQKAYIEVKLFEESDEKHDLKDFNIN